LKTRPKPALGYLQLAFCTPRPISLQTLSGTKLTVKGHICFAAKSNLDIQETKHSEPEVGLLNI